MRRLLAPCCVLTLVGGCYLFSDEPKARKQPGSEAGEPGAATDAAADSAVDSPGATTTTAGEAELTATADCPKFLTGTETEARTIPTTCASVRVRGQYRIDGGSLTVEPGVELRFEQDAVLEVGRDRPGVLTLAGTPEQPVRLVADMVGDVGGWQGLRLHAQAGGSALTHAELRGAGTASEAALWAATEDFTAEGLSIAGAPGLALELVSERAPTLAEVRVAGTGVVARVSPHAAAALHGVRVEPTAKIAVTSGKIATPIEWPAQQLRVEGVIRIEGAEQQPAALSVTPGATLTFTPEARLIVGGFGPGSLAASAARPGEGPPPSLPTDPQAPPGPPNGGAIRLLAADDARPGSWSGVQVLDQGQILLRGVELGYGGSRDEGVVVAEGTASVTLDGCDFHDNLVGVELRGTAVTVTELRGNRFRATPIAFALPPSLVAAIGPDHEYDAVAEIAVERGKIEADASWALPAAPLRIRGDVFVDAGATLTVAPGSRLGFEPGVTLGVGYYERASLDLRGTAEAPIVLAPAPPRAQPGGDPAVEAAEPRPWTGIVLGPKALKARFEHVRLRGTEGAAGIELRDGAEATLVNVDCAGCANATVTWDCTSKIGNLGVTASAGTPTAMAAPSGCP